MSAIATVRPASASSSGSRRLHALGLAVVAIVIAGGVGWIGWSGATYYLTPLAERPFHDLHREFRPSGRVGIRLGFLAAACFFCLYLYPLRKRWKYLQRFGKTRNWLDVHVMFGLSVPWLVTLHSSFKLNGLAGLAYWIMIAIVLSGIVGRYLYAQIPRSASATELSVKELEDQAAAIESELLARDTFRAEVLARVFRVPSREEVGRMSVLRALVTVFILDVARPFRVAELRRSVLSSRERWTSLGGLLRSGHSELEDALTLIQRRAWLTAKMQFLQRVARLFHLWHVVHRPFSWSFLLLVGGHILVVFLMGFF